MYRINSAKLNLIYQLVKRDIQQRFKNSMLGIAWAFIVPLAMLSIYTFVFRGVLNARWPGADTDADFALNVFCGLIVFNMFSEVVGRAPRIISEQPNMVKKVVFPLEVLAWTSTLNALFYSVISMAVLLVGVIFVKGGVQLSMLSILFVFLAYIPILVGLSWFLSAVGVYIPDAQHIVGLILTPMLFLSPVFYPASALPEKVQLIMSLNPLTTIIEASRCVLIKQEWPDWNELLIYFVVSVSLFGLGYLFFKKTKSGFADVL
ncbi:ABC transporter permease [Pseudomonadota bacterium 24LQ007]